MMDFFYWSVKDSAKDSVTCRGKLIYENGKLNVEKDPCCIIGASKSTICTHPDSWEGKFRDTLRASDGEFFIGEMK